MGRRKAKWHIRRALIKREIVEVQSACGELAEFFVRVSIGKRKKSCVRNMLRDPKYAEKQLYAINDRERTGGAGKAPPCSL